MSKHTPGPWGPHRHSELAVVGKTGFVVAACGGYSTNTIGPEELNEELRANAKLIAAAPDLLQALQEALNAHDSNYEKQWDVAQWYLKASSAIKKATE